MISYDQVYQAREEVFAMIADDLRVRPQGIGIIEMSDGVYGLKVNLARKPAEELPTEFRGIPITYDIGHAEPVLMGGEPALPEWRRRIRATRD